MLSQKIVFAILFLISLVVFNKLITYKWFLCNYIENNVITEHCVFYV